MTSASHRDAVVGARRDRRLAVVRTVVVDVVETGQRRRVITATDGESNVSLRKYVPLETVFGPVVPFVPVRGWESTWLPPADVPILSVTLPAVPLQTFFSSIVPTC